ncbi:MAG: GAF domain-containing sensor histidine kinase [Mycobacteriales bacterium]
MVGRRMGWVLLALGVVSVVAVPVAGVVGHQVGRAAANVPLVLIYVATGTVAFVQQPDLRAARRLLGFGVSLAVAFAVGYCYSAIVAQQGVPAWSGVMVPLLSAAGWLTTTTVLGLFAVFPDGAYHRRYERGLVAASWLLLPVLLAGQAVGSRQLRINTPYVWLSGDVTGRNPFAVDALAPVGRVAGGVLAAAQVWVLIGVVVLVLRYRRADADTRRQIAWPLYTLGLTVACTAVLGSQSNRINHLPVWEGYTLFYPVLLLLPAGLLLGMLRHRLLDIDLVVRRSVVYGALWLVIAAVYVAVAAGFGMLVGRRVPLDVAIVLTIVATAVAAPIRRRLEQLANRVVFGKRLTGYELISELGARLESSVAPDVVTSEVVTAIRDGIGAKWVRIELDAPLVRAVPSQRPVADEQMEPALSVPLVHGDEVVGALLCGPKREGQYRPADETLLRTLGRQGALALRTAQLSSELSERLAELAASRARLVEAEESSRRRLERDLHDGVQQELVALLARLSMARNQLRRDASLAETTLAHVQADARRALESLQELVRGIHPAVLTDRGLLEAVEELVTRVPLPARVENAGLPPGLRMEPGVEGAAYFFVSEALSNVLKHARASQILIRLHVDGDDLAVEVRDDGCGFNVGAGPWRGLRGLADRVEALGGRLSVTSTPGHGSSVHAWLPAEVRASA